MKGIEAEIVLSIGQYLRNQVGLIKSSGDDRPRLRVFEATV